MMEKNCEINTKSCFVALVGRPNVGKSTLLNRLVGEKVAIVSPKPQTTRTRVIGLVTEKETQYVFIDTPGLHLPKNKLGEYMVGQVRQSVNDVDVILMLIQADKPVGKAERELIRRFEGLKLPVICVINKMDLLKKREDLLSVMQQMSKLYPFDHIVPISALKDDGVKHLRALLSEYAKEGEHFYPDDEFTDQPEKAMAAELIREKLLYALRDEIPHGVAVVVESFKPRESGKLVDIQVIIYCEKESHKGIILGKGGETIKQVASGAREGIEALVGQKVNLQCWVKVKEDWRNKQRLISNFGYN